MDESEFFELAKNNELEGKKQQARDVGIPEYIIDKATRIAQSDFEKWKRTNLKQQLGHGHQCWQDHAMFSLQCKIDRKR